MTRKVRRAGATADPRTDARTRYTRTPSAERPAQRSVLAPECRCWRTCCCLELQGPCVLSAPPLLCAMTSKATDSDRGSLSPAVYFRDAQLRMVGRNLSCCSSAGGAAVKGNRRARGSCVSAAAASRGAAGVKRGAPAEGEEGDGRRQPAPRHTAPAAPAAAAPAAAAASAVHVRNATVRDAAWVTALRRDCPWLAADGYLPGVQPDGMARNNPGNPPPHAR